jgi:hypothetical protein
MIRAAAIAMLLLANAQAPVSPAAPPAHVISIHADLESPLASRAMVVVRTFVAAHPGVASIEFHLAPPAGELRAVDRAVAAAGAQTKDASLAMAELILANPDRRGTDDLIAMARQLRLDEGAFRTALTSGEIGAAMRADLSAAAAKPSPPVLVAIDGQVLTGTLTLADLESRLVVR